MKSQKIRNLIILAAVLAIVVLTMLLLPKHPVSAEPTAEIPAAEEPVIETPVTDGPIVEEPAEEAPAAEVPAAKEPAAEEEPPEEPIAQAQCTVSISCAELLENMDLLAEEKRELIPSDGLLLPPTAVMLTGGESVFDVVFSAVKANALHMEYTKGATSYIEGVCNLYEFDAGPASGWTYSVNGTFPNLDSGVCAVENGDNVQLVYSLTPKTGQ